MGYCHTEQFLSWSTVTQCTRGGYETVPRAKTENKFLRTRIALFFLNFSQSRRVCTFLAPYFFFKERIFKLDCSLTRRNSIQISRLWVILSISKKNQCY